MPLTELGRRAKAASRLLATASTETKNQALQSAADLLGSHRDELLGANADDVARAERGGRAAPSSTGCG